MIKHGQDVGILSGKYQGAAGLVLEIRESGKALVSISGLVGGQPVNTSVWLNVTQLKGM